MTFNNLDDILSFFYDNIHLNYASGSFPPLHEYLGHSQDQRAFLALLEGLRKGGDYIRALSAIGLGYFNDRASLPYLVDTFLHDKALYVRCDAALAIGYLKASDAIPVMLETFPLEHFEVQKRIVSALIKINTNEAIKGLQSIKEKLETDPYEQDNVIIVIINNFFDAKN